MLFSCKIFTDLIPFSKQTINITEYLVQNWPLIFDSTEKNEIQSLNSRNSACNRGDNEKANIKIQYNNIYVRCYSTMFFKLEY